LLPQQGVLGNEVALPAAQGGQRVHGRTRGRRRGDRPQTTLKRVDQTVAEAAGAAEKGSKHEATP
jgi:hypothetical protein